MSEIRQREDDRISGIADARSPIPSGVDGGDRDPKSSSFVLSETAEEGR